MKFLTGKLNSRQQECKVIRQTLKGYTVSKDQVDLTAKAMGQELTSKPTLQHETFELYDEIYASLDKQKKSKLIVKRDPKGKRHPGEWVPEHFEQIRRLRIMTVFKKVQMYFNTVEHNLYNSVVKIYNNNLTKVPSILVPYPVYEDFLQQLSRLKIAHDTIILLGHNFSKLYQVLRKVVKQFELFFQGKAMMANIIQTVQDVQIALTHQQELAKKVSKEC